MRRPRSDDDEDGGLDSLLDTMTNVVGILVLVLIVTQMSVSEVVKRVVEETQVTDEKLQELKQELEQNTLEEEELEKILVAPQEVDADKQKEELQKAREKLERLKQQREQKKTANAQFAMKIKEDQEKAEAAKKQIADTDAARKALSRKISDSLARKAELEAMLDKTPVRAKPADIVVSIPNPRPAPPGARQASFLCSANTLYPINVETFRKRAAERAKAIVARLKLGQDKAKGIDPKKFTPQFVKLSDRDDFFDVEYYVDRDRYLRMRFHPREKKGATDRSLINTRSPIRKNYLSNLDISKYYARFYVLPDSYDIYLTARRIFQKQSMLAGWDPQSQDWKYTTWVGTVELGPPLPKNPNPAPPGKPANVID